MPRKIEYIGEVVEISDYQECHRPDNQTNIVQGVPIDPILRSDFDMTPNDQREDLELHDWWDRPFIVTLSWADLNESWGEYCEKRALLGLGPEGSESGYLALQKTRKGAWLESYPGGTRYEVRCLDGGAWDRSTSKGFFDEFDNALAKALLIKSL